MTSHDRVANTAPFFVVAVRHTSAVGGMEKKKSESEGIGWQNLTQPRTLAGLGCLRFRPRIGAKHRRALERGEGGGIRTGEPQHDAPTVASDRPPPRPNRAPAGTAYRLDPPIASDRSRRYQTPVCAE